MLFESHPPSNQANLKALLKLSPLKIRHLSLRLMMKDRISSDMGNVSQVYPRAIFD
ncbi:hypothetical protein DW2_06123 [Thioclava atlantica]|uniref:Uncharacterized protein n=1 Tax=Thioclava atlantica TaxID=1317124 RepID=A0A085TXR8_9RHOB|nr:hypothetical protein DW2_06123 [Thioclava atlantica]